jgi:hypothetical protein
MLTTEQINELHRLYWPERWPIRKIERHLRMGWRTIRKYLEQPLKHRSPASAPASWTRSKPPSPSCWGKMPRRARPSDEFLCPTPQALRYQR